MGPTEKELLYNMLPVPYIASAYEQNIVSGKLRISKILREMRYNTLLTTYSRCTMLFIMAALDNC
jgi:hypothetical protein